MKIFLVFYCFLSVFILNAQEVNKEFTKLLWSEQFNNLSNQWENTFNADNLFIAQNGYYELFRKNKKSGYYLFPNSGEDYGALRLDCELSFADHKNKRQSAGVILMGQINGSQGILIEINQKREYRIVRLIEGGKIILSGNKESGWIKLPNILTKVSNQITVKAYNKVYDLYLNGVFIQSFTEIEIPKGKVGIYIGADSKAKFDYLSIYAEDINTLTTINNKDEKSEEKSFTLIIIKLKEQLNQKEKEIDDLRLKLKLCENNVSSNPTTHTNIQKDTAQTNLIQRLRVDINNKQNELDLLTLKVLKLEKDNETLTNFKKGVEKNQENGDIIINLTNMVSTQKAKLEELENKNTSLNNENNSLFIETKELTKNLEKTTNQLSAAKLENAQYRRQMDSLTNVIKNLKDSLSKSAIEPNNDKGKNTELDEQEALRQLIEKERMERLRKKEEEEKLKREIEGKKEE